MSDMKRRESAFEDKYAHDAEMNFKAEARASKLFGLWLAPQLGLEGGEADAYAKGVVGANLEEDGFDDIIRYVMPDIQDKGLDISEHLINAKMAEFMSVAKAQLMEELE